jgi:ankyrin repeat protein
MKYIEFIKNSNESIRLTCIVNLYILEHLIEDGINFKDIKFNMHENMLHLASLNGHKEMIELLINKGIDLNEKDKESKNALDLASERGHKEIVELLKNKGIDK